MKNNSQSILLAAVILTVCLLSLSLDASASDRCRKVRANQSVTNNGDGTTSGTVTQGGILNGTTRAVFTSPLTPTPSANVFSYNGNLTLTTNRGVLKLIDNGIFDVGHGLFADIGRIDGTNSTGIFAGATGTLFFTGTSPDGGATFEDEITGEICLDR